MSVRIPSPTGQAIEGGRGLEFSAFVPTAQEARAGKKVEED